MFAKAMNNSEILSNVKTLTMGTISKPNKAQQNLTTQNIIFKEFFAKFNTLASLETLDISNSQLGVGGTKQLSEWLGENKTVKNLNLHGNFINVDGVRYVSEALEKNNTIQYLDLGLNLMKGKGLKYIKAALLKNKNSVLETLIVKQNSIRVETLTSFIKDLKINNTSKLQRL